MNVLNFQNRFGWIDDLVVNNGIDFGRNVVFCDCILWWNVDGLQAQIDFGHGLKDREDDFPTRFNHGRISTHGEFYAAFELVDLTERDENDGDHREDEKKWHRLGTIGNKVSLIVQNVPCFGKLWCGENCFDIFGGIGAVSDDVMNGF